MAEIDDAARGALSRARSHLRGAEVLASRRQFALAYSILVLSFEELGKAVVPKLVADDVLSFNPRDKGSEKHVDPNSIFRGQRSHQVKQAVAGTIAVQTVALIRLVELYRRLTGDMPTEGDVEQLAISIAHPRRPPPDFLADESVIEKALKIRAELFEFSNAIPQLDGWKQKGFYTDLAPYSGHTSTVVSRRAVNYHRFHETMQTMLEIGRVLVLTPTSKEQLERMKSLERMREFAFTHA